MKHLFYTSIVLICTMLFGCKSDTKSYQNTSAQQNVELPNEYEMGMPKRYEPTDQIEENLISQIDLYHNALIYADIETLRSFVYKDAITFFKRNNTSDKDIDDMFFDVSKRYNEKRIAYEKEGCEIGLIVEDILRKINTPKALCFVVSVSVYHRYVDKQTGIERAFHTKATKTDDIIAISFNNGTTWTFLGMSEVSSDILSIKLPASVVNEIIG